MKTDITVRYKADGVVKEVENKIIDRMAKIGAQLWATGYDFRERMRDLEFEMEVPE